MEGNQKCTYGVIAKSHPKSIIRVIKANTMSDYNYYSMLFSDSPTINEKPVTLLQITAVSTSTYIVEFIYTEDYIKNESQI